MCQLMTQLSKGPGSPIFKEKSLNSLLNPPEIHIGSTGNYMTQLHHLGNYSGHKPFVGTDDDRAGEPAGGIIRIGGTGPCGEHLVRQDPGLRGVRVVNGSWLPCTADIKDGDMAHQPSLGLEHAMAYGGMGMLCLPQPWVDWGQMDDGVPRTCGSWTNHN